MSTLEMLSEFLREVFGIDVSTDTLMGMFAAALFVLLLGAALYELCAKKKEKQ